jgi:predicted CopG family antitoxin
LNTLYYRGWLSAKRENPAGFSEVKKMLFKARRRTASQVIERALVKAKEASVNVRERMSFDSAGVVAMRQVLAELICYRCGVKYRDHAGADHVWIECAEDMESDGK